MLGYDAYSLKFGANALFHSQLLTHFWGPHAMHDFPLVEGSNPSAVPEADRSLVTFLGNHPNPFNPATTISYRLSESTRITLRNYDLAGRLIRTLDSGKDQAAGPHQYNWRGLNDSGQDRAVGRLCLSAGGWGIRTEQKVDAPEIVLLGFSTDLCSTSGGQLLIGGAA